MFLVSKTQFPLHFRNSTHIHGTHSQCKVTPDTAFDKPTNGFFSVFTPKINPRKNIPHPTLELLSHTPSAQPRLLSSPTSAKLHQPELILASVMPRKPKNPKFFTIFQVSKNPDLAPNRNKQNPLKLNLEI